MILRSEAHLPPLTRSLPLVRYLRRPRKSWTGWAIFVGLLALNETRGTLVAAQFLAALLKAYR